MPDPKTPAKNRRSGERRTGPRAPGSAVWYVLGFLLLLAVAQAFFFQIQSGETISYSDFKARIREDKVQEVTLSEDRVRGTLKAEDGGPMTIGGATLAAAAMRAGLIDEYVLATHPVLVGAGTPFFTALDAWVHLDLVETRTFPGGVVMTRYATRR